MPDYVGSFESLFCCRYPAVTTNILILKVSINH